MDLSALVAAQSSADRRRGFKLDFETDADRIAQLEQDIVGLIGEIGEFSNVLKKVRLAASHIGYAGPSLAEASQGMREELADALIYLIRLSVVIGGSLENDLISKMQVNDGRYGHLEESET